MPSPRNPLADPYSPLQIDPAAVLLETPGAAGAAAIAGASAAALPQRVIEASEGLRTTGDYDPAPTVELMEMMLPGGLAKAEAGAIGALGGRGTTVLQPNAALATRYPATAKPGVFEKLPGGKKGKEHFGPFLGGGKPPPGTFWGAVDSPESKEFLKMRHAVQKDIDAGNYTPFFDVEKRRDVKAADYPGYQTTAGQVPKVPPPPAPGGPTKKYEKALETSKKYTEHAENPEATARLEEAYLKGKQMPNADRWYFMQQLEAEFVKELGPIEGRKQFDARFASPMAATTGGSNPTGNLMTAMWANWMTGKGKKLPQTPYQRAAEIPAPVGGRYMEGNIEQYEKMQQQGITPANPKRWNFRWNFLGEKGPTIDEQMSRLFDPKMSMPEFYGPYQQALEKLAAKHGVDAREFQEVAWAGTKALKEKYKVSKPMIQIVNEAIERTSRITGVAPDEVVKRALIYGTMPLYGTVGVVAADKIADQIVQRYQNEEGM